MSPKNHQQSRLKNKFEVLSEKNEETNQVFHQANPELTKSLKEMMLKLTSIESRQEKQERKLEKLDSSNPNWRNKDSSSPSQAELRKAWDSQRRREEEDSQNQYY